jgi:hypothetical protein
MASGLSVYYANKVLDKLLRGTDFTPPASMWVALFMASGSSTYLRADDVASATEMVGDTYARVKIMSGTSISFNVAAAGHSDNNADIAFPAAGAGWGTAYAIATMDAASSGHVVMWADIVPIVISAPDVVTISAAYFDVNL